MRREEGVERGCGPSNERTCQTAESRKEKGSSFQENRRSGDAATVRLLELPRQLHPDVRRSSTATSSGCRREQLWYTDQLVVRHGQREFEAEPGDASDHGARQAADHFAPAERFFGALSLRLAHRIAGMPRGA